MKSILSLAVFVVVLLLGFHCLTAPTLMAADTLPGQISDAEFWKMVKDFSEPDGEFPYENFVSNEISYQTVLPQVKQIVQPGGVYLGVAPDQNFTYIAAIQPKIAFIIDIRRQNMIELLMYKAIFEMAPDRATFLSRLFSRPRPAQLTDASSLEDVFNAFNKVAPSDPLKKETLTAIKDQLVKVHKFDLSKNDLSKIELILGVFYNGGPRMDYRFKSATPTQNVPSFESLMMTTDRQGTNWNFLATKAAYDFVRAMEQKNLIVPIVGDFAGPKALRAIGGYLKSKGAKVSVFYISNVEYYIDKEPAWSRYRANIEALPVDESSRSIRWVSATGITSLLPITPPAIYTRDR